MILGPKTYQSADSFDEYINQLGRIPKRSIVFLAIDRLTQNGPSQKQDEPAVGRHKPDNLARRTELYQGALVVRVDM